MIVLIEDGVGGRRRDWEAVCDLLEKDGAEVHYHDRTVLSDLAAADYLDAVVADAAQWVEKRGADEVTLVGHSIGAVYAALIADRLSSLRPPVALVMIDPPVHPSTAAMDGWFRFLVRIFRQGFRVMALLTRRSHFATGYLDSISYDAAMSKLASIELDPAMTRVRLLAPNSGERGQQRQSDQERLVSRLGSGSIVTLEDSSHRLHLKQAAEVAAWVRATGRDEELPTTTSGESE